MPKPKPKTDIANKLLLTTSEVCALTGFGRTKLHEVIKSGALKATRFGRRLLIARAHLEEYLEALPLAGRKSAGEDHPQS